MTFDLNDAGVDAARAALERSRAALCARVAALRAQPDRDFIDAFPAVVAAVEAGFRHEETLLDRIGDTCLRTRRADDAVILCALHRVMPRIERGDIALGRQVAAALDAVLSLRPAPATGAGGVAGTGAAAGNAWRVRAHGAQRRQRPRSAPRFSH